VTAHARSGLVVGMIAACTGTLLALSVWSAQLLDGTAYAHVGETDREELPFIAAVVSAVVVGAVLAVRRPRHPVGWLFLALGWSILFSAVIEPLALYAIAANKDGQLTGLAAVVSDGTWIVWFVLVLWILHLTPTGSPLSPRWRNVAIASTVAAALLYGGGLIYPDPLDPPLDEMRSPWGVGGDAAATVSTIRTLLGYATGVGLILAGVSLLVRFRRARGNERKQLLWLAIVVVPLPIFVALAYYASPEHPTLLALAVAGFICLIPIAAGLSIARYHLYDVEQIVSRAVAWMLASVVLAVTFLLVVVTAGRFVGDRGGDSSLPAVLATLGAVAVAVPAYRGFQDAIDRRFNRRRYDAIRRIQTFVRDPDPATSVEEVLRSALEDPSLSVGYWLGDRDEWVRLDGRVMVQMDSQIDVRRQGRPVARISYDTTSVDVELAEAVCGEATPELENAMLRARISLQLAEVRESRARIASAHVTERRRLERNLHDGAQQRLLALALELRAAQVNGTQGRLEQGVAEAIDELQAAVLELRELANGLHPAVLQSQGLAGALEDLASRFPVDVQLHGLDGRRFPEEIEAAAWFIACEGVTNAVKHASASHIGVAVSARDGTLTVRVTDDGVGHADATGHGLRGLADRTEAAGGSLVVESADGRTTVIGELPCGS
jgi:signal transduction histidine kinase